MLRLRWRGGWQKFRKGSAKFLKRLSPISIFVSILAAIFFAGGCGRSASPGVISITLMPLTTISMDESESITFTAVVTNDYTNSGVVWQIYNDTSTTPYSCNIPSCGTLSGATRFNVTYTAPAGLLTTQKITLQATSAALASITAKATITVVQPMIINTLSLPNGENGVPYKQTISVTGGVTPLNYSITAGTLPAGITVGSGGIIAGTPSGAGSSAFTLQISDSATPPATVSMGYTITISPPQPLSISTTSPLPQAVVGTAYSETISSLGGTPPLTWTLIGTLPAGLTFTTNTNTGSTKTYTTGEISGVPLTAGTFTFSVEVQDSSIPIQTATASFSLTINPATPLSITTTSLPVGTTALGYNAVVQATGGAAPLTWTLGPGLLPPGLVLNPTSGTITGTPVRTGTSNFIITVTDSEVPAQTVSMNYSITVAANSNVLQEYELFNGPYAFLFSGYGKLNSTTPFPELIAGQLSANGTGAISSGVEDVNSNGALSDLGFSGSYTIGTDGRGTMQLTVTGPSDQKIVQNYLLALDAEGNGQFLEADNTGSRGSGILIRQTSASFSSASFNGRYTFSFFGFDQNLKRSVVAGEFQANGASSLADGEADQNDNGTMENFAINGTFGGINAAGRGSATLFFSPNTIGYAIYLVSPTEVMFISNAMSSTNQSGHTTTTNAPPSAGIAYLQTDSPYSGISLSGNYVASGTGTSAAGDSSIFGSLIAFASTGASTGTDTASTFDQNDGGTISSAVPGAGSYSVISSGRVAFTGGTSRVGIAYIVSPSEALFVGADSEASLGTIELQTTAPSFDISSLEGEFTLKDPTSADSQATTVSGVPAADGAGNLAGEIDSVTGGDTQNVAQALSATYTMDANGRGVITNGSGAGLPASLAVYLISPEKFTLISTDPTDAHPAVFFLDY